MNGARQQSSPAIAAPPRRRTDPDNTWRPEDDDDGEEATAKRARLALVAVEELRADRDADRAVISRLATSMDGLAGSMSTLSRLLRWAGALLGGAFLLGGGKWFWDWLTSLHH